jgi:hypothetical protein
MSRNEGLLTDTVIAVPIGLKDHFETNSSAAHQLPAGGRYFDPTDPGHDYLSDPEPAKKGLVAKILGR